MLLSKLMHSVGCHYPYDKIPCLPPPLFRQGPSWPGTHSATKQQLSLDS